MSVSLDNKVDRVSMVGFGKPLAIGVVVLSLIFLYFALSKPAKDQVNTAVNIVIELTKEKVELNHYLYSQLATWQGSHINAKDYADFDVSSLSVSQFNNLTYYLIHRFKFAPSQEREAMVKIYSHYLTNTEEQLPGPEIEYFNCLSQGECDYKALIELFPSSKWVPHWAIEADNRYVEGMSQKLNELDLSAVKNVTYFKYKPKNTELVVAPPKLADYIVTIPFYENCENNNQELLLYLYEVKLIIPDLKGLSEEFMALAKNGVCE